MHKKVEEEARKKAEEEGRRRRTEEGRKKTQSMEVDKRKKTLRVTVIHPQEPEAGSSQVCSSRSMGWQHDPKTPCVNCTWLEIECEALSLKSQMCWQCKVSRIVCREPGAQKKAVKRQTIDITSPQGGKD